MTHRRPAREALVIVLSVLTGVALKSCDRQIDGRIGEHPTQAFEGFCRHAGMPLSCDDGVHHLQSPLATTAKPISQSVDRIEEGE